MSDFHIGGNLRFEVELKKEGGPLVKEVFTVNSLVDLYKILSDGYSGYQIKSIVGGGLDGSTSP